MATTIANNDYVIIDKNNIVISLFHGYDLPEYNEEMTNVMDVTDITPKPQIGWSYDLSNDNFTAPPELEIEELVEEKSPVDLLREELSNSVSLISYMGTEFQTGGVTISIVNSYVSLLAIGGNLPENFFWLDKLNNKVPMTEEQFKGFAQLAITNYYTHFANYVEQRQML
jgi:hypothetical protein